MIKTSMVQPVASSPLPPGGDPFVGTPYRWLRRVGGGGMGDVHLVEHTVLGSEFAAKVLHAKYAGSKQLVDRVRVEAQSLARLEHPNIVRVASFGRLRDERPFIIMEALTGNTLDSEVRGRDRLPLVEAIRYALQLASALAAAHELGIIHRDVKPENLFLHHEHDGSRLLKVLDFGVARIVPGISDASPVPLTLPTDTGIVVGTPRYVSPEAAKGQRVDHRADIYSAGLVLYFMLTGRGPFDHIRDERLVLAAHAHEPPPPLSTHSVEGVTPELEEILRRTLAKAPEQRFASARELEARLAALLQRTVSSVEHSAKAPGGRSASPSAALAPQSRQTPPVAAPPPLAPEPETPAPILALREGRSRAFIAGLFLAVTLVFGLASAGAVAVLRRALGGP